MFISKRKFAQILAEETLKASFVAQELAVAKQAKQDLKKGGKNENKS